MGGVVSAAKDVVKRQIGGTIGSIGGSVGLGSGGLLTGTAGSIFGAAQGAGLLGSGAGRQLSVPNVGLSENARRLARMEDIATGEKFAGKVLGEGLGRLSTQPGIQDALEAQRALLGGLSAPEMQAQRDIATQGIQGATESARRRLAAAQARAGVRGATAGAQQMGILGQGIQARQNMEQQLLLADRAAKSKAAEELLAGQGAVSKFDLAQAAREKQARLAGGLGFAQLGSAERSGTMGAQAAIAAAQAQKPSGGLLGGVLGK